MIDITIVIKTSFGEILTSGKSIEEVLQALDVLNKDFIIKLNAEASSLLVNRKKNNLKEIIEVRRDGPIIITRMKITHYESIGLLLYALKDNQALSKEIKKMLTASGKKVTIYARLYEMRNRGHVYKPIEKEPRYKLTLKGINWIEEIVLPSLIQDR